jgi:cytochrome c oxidase subunit 2
MMGPLKRLGNWRAATLLGAIAGPAPFSSALAWNAEGKPVPGQIDLPHGATIVARQLVEFHNELLIIITAITLFVLGLLAFAAFRFRRSANPNPTRTTHNTLIEVIWTAVPVIILVVIALPSFQLLYFMDRAQKPEMTVKITGHQWYWSYEMPDQKVEDYISAMVPDEKIGGDRIRLLSVDYPLVVPTDTTIQLLFTGADVIHSWLVGDLGVQKSAFPGRTNESWMRIDHEGTFYGQCTQICGDRHGYMPIEVRAVSKEKFAQWVDIVQHSAAKDKLRDANEKVLGIDYSWMDQPSKTAAIGPRPAAEAPGAHLIANR